MVGRIRLASPAAWVTFFVILAAIPLAALAWLGWRVLEQDRVLEGQRIRESLDNAAALAARELDRSLATWEQLLPAAAQGEAVALPSNTILIVFDARGVVRRQGVALPYYPRVATGSSVPAALFAEAQELEFRQKDLIRAAAAYRRLVASTDPSVKGTALVRLARVLRAGRQLNEALNVYGDLLALGETHVAGAPAALVARRERAALLEGMARETEAANEIQELAAALVSGQYAIDRVTFDFYRESVPVLPMDDESDPGGRALATLVESLWARWETDSSGRTAVSDASGTYVSTWRRTPTGTAALVGEMSDQLASIDALAANLGVRLTLMDSDGRVIRGDSARTADASGVTRSLRETGLPWTLQASLIEPGAAQALSGQRRTVFTAGFALMLLVIAGAGFVMFRAVHRELRVAQLQADFVAAVSHEFRTPLAAMCHLTEMLEEGGEEGGVSAERLPQYYQALGRESRRLSGMVERLLDFGRIDAGRRRYELVETDPQELVTEVVQMCRDQAPASAHRVRWDRPSPASPTSGDAPGIRADREALGLALRNLIDNAIKYSPDTSPVTVTLTSQGQFVRIAVSDEGAGIPKDEQRAIFRKFARGSAAQAMNVKGTGIGLAMTGQIVKAHGGRVEVESHPGRGSTFTVVLPAVRGVRLQPDLANRNPAKAGSHGA